MTIHLSKINGVGDGSGGGGGSSSKGALFDVKTMTEAIVEKGWACLSHTTRKDIAKSDIPTMYNNIFNKFINADKGLDVEIDYDNASITYDKKTQTTVWKNSGSDIYVSENLDLSNPQSITLTDLYNDGQDVRAIICGENINVVFGHFDNKCYIYDKEWNFIKKYDFNAYGDYMRFYKAIEGYIILCFYDSYNSKMFIIKVDDNATANYEATPNLFDYDMEHQNYHLEPYRISKVYNGNLYITCLRGTGVSLLKLNINDFSQYTEYETNIDDGSIVTQVGSTSINMTELVIVDNTYYLGAGENMYSSTNLTDWTAIKSLDSYCYSLFDVGNGEYYLTGNGYILKTTNFSAWTQVATFNVEANNYSFYFFYADANVITCSMSYPNMWLYGENLNTQYSDKYMINGSSVEVKYFKNGSYKIFLSDNDNNTNIASVYSYLGYHNYYVIDLENETVSLPQNSNLWTYMYVGDNYQDTLDGISGNATRLLPQAENINVTGATPTITISANKTYSFDTAITSLTISDVETSALESVLYFTTGAGTIQFTAPNTLRWGGGNEQPQLEPNTVYCIAIRNGLAEIDNFGSAS